ncbi:putative DNA ligase (ATP) [Helianthus anomalus]
MELSRAQEGSSRSQEEGDPLRGSESDMETDPLCVGNKWNNSTCEDKTKVYNPFLMACYDPYTDEYQSVCRVMSCFSDAFCIEVRCF